MHFVSPNTIIDNIVNYTYIINYYYDFVVVVALAAEAVIEAVIAIYIKHVRIINVYSTLNPLFIHSMQIVYATSNLVVSFHL